MINAQKVGKVVLLRNFSTVWSKFTCPELLLLQHYKKSDPHLVNKKVFEFLISHSLTGTRISMSSNRSHFLFCMLAKFFYAFNQRARFLSPNS